MFFFVFGGGGGVGRPESKKTNNPQNATKNTDRSSLIWRLNPSKRNSTENTLTMLFSWPRDSLQFCNKTNPRFDVQPFSCVCLSLNKTIPPKQTPPQNINGHETGFFSFAKFTNTLLNCEVTVQVPLTCYSRPGPWASCIHFKYRASTPWVEARLSCDSWP